MRRVGVRAHRNSTVCVLPAWVSPVMARKCSRSRGLAPFPNGAWRIDKGTGYFSTFKSCLSPFSCQVTFAREPASKCIMKDLIPTERIEQAIFLIRGQKVLLDADLAVIYGVLTKGLNQAVKRNLRRFPSDFVFRLTAEELEAIQSQIVAGANRSQIVTGSQKHRDPRFLPYAFTEHGAIMAANVLNSRRAVQMSVFVVRAFVKMRSVFTDTRDLARKLASLEQELNGRLDGHEDTIVTILHPVLDILEPPPVPRPPSKPRIGLRS